MVSGAACCISAGVGECPDAQQSSLLAAVQRIVPSSQAALVLPLLIKLTYLEGQVTEKTTVSDPTAAAWDCGL